MNDLKKLGEFAESIAARVDLETEDVERYIHSFFDLIKSEVAVSGKIVIHPFGTFKKERVESTERSNPRTHERVTVPAHYKVLFTPMPATARKVNREFSGLKSIILEENEGELIFPPDSKQFRDAGYSPELIREIRPSLLRKAAQYRSLADSLSIRQPKKAETENGTQINKKERKPLRLAWLWLLLLLLPLIGLGIGGFRYFSERNRAISAGRGGTRFEVDAEEVPPGIEGGSEVSQTQIVAPEGSKTAVGAAKTVGDLAADQAGTQTAGTQTAGNQTAGTQTELPESEAIGEKNPQSPISGLLQAQTVETRDIEPAPVATHSVRRGDSFSLLAQEYWDDMFLWPHLYAPNSSGYPDPDRLLPGNPVRIPSAPGAEDRKAVEKDAISVYRRYKELILVERDPGRIGFRERNLLGTLAGAELLYPGFLELYGSEIESKDRIAAAKRASLGRGAQSATVTLRTDQTALR